MKLIILFILLFINYSRSDSCDKFLNKFKDSSKCIQISISGTHKDNLAQEGYKGNLKFNNVTNTLEVVGFLNNLQTYEVVCIDGLYQPFSVMDSFNYKDFKIFSNGTLRINNVFFADLICFPNDDFVAFKLNNFLYSLSMKSYTTCPTLYYGEACILSTPTPTPTSTPTSTPTTSPTFNIKFQNTLNNQWDRNNSSYYQFTTILTNNEKSAIKSIEISNDSKLGISEIWGLEKLSNNNFGFPGYISKIDTNGTFTFGFVSTLNNPSFTIKSITYL